MRRISPRVFPLIMLGGVLLLSILGTVAGIASFLLLRAGYGPLVWGLPPLALLLVALVLIAAIWWATGGAMPGRGGRSAARDPVEESRGGASRGDRADDV